MVTDIIKKERRIYSIEQEDEETLP